MRATSPLVGGPYDGAQIGQREEPFLWVGGSETEPRCFRAPRRGSHLYRCEGASYIYAGHSHAHCACGGYNEIFSEERDPRCELCGDPIRRAELATR